MTQTHRQALPRGYMLQDYQLDRVLGAGGFGLTYLGWDTRLDKPVAVKEYLPNDLAVRETDHSVLPKSHDDEGSFQWGLERFLDEARTLARFKHPNVIAVHRYFEEHNTAYIVMEFAEGETLDDVLKRGVLEESRLLAVLIPLLEGLAEVHRGDFLHRDIKPGNIVIRPDGSPVLLDFGAARQAIGSRSRSITSVVTPGYAPIEQYDTRGKQGPWTDIYALGAVAYKAVSGEAPPDATGRMRQDPMRPASEVCRGKYSESLLHSIDWALSVEEESRPQDVVSWRKSLTGEAAVPSGEPVPVRKKSREPKPEKKRRTGLIVTMLLLVTAFGGGYLYLRQAISACQDSYSAGNHQSVILACQTLANAGVAEAVSVIVRSEARQEAARLAKKKAAEEEAARLAREKAAQEEAERLARERAAQEEAARLAKKKAEEEAARLARKKAEEEEAARLARKKAAEEEAARLARELTPICETPTVEGDPACWLKVENHDNCYLWISPGNEQTITWSGQCRGGKPHGRGKLTWKSEGKETSSHTGSHMDGVKHGQWNIRFPDGSERTGPYVDGKMHGRWEERGTNGRTYSGSYVDGKRQGQWGQKAEERKQREREQERQEQERERKKREQERKKQERERQEQERERQEQELEYQRKVRRYNECIANMPNPFICGFPPFPP